MATLAIPHFEHTVNPVFFIGWLFPPGQQIGSPAQAQTAPKLLQTGFEEHGIKAMLSSLAVVPLALAAVFLWPVLFVALVLLLVGLTPFVVATRVLAFLRRGRPAAEVRRG